MMGGVSGPVGMLRSLETRTCSTWTPCLVSADRAAVVVEVEDSEVSEGHMEEEGLWLIR